MASRMNNAATLMLDTPGKARFFGPALSQFNKAIFLSNSGG